MRPSGAMLVGKESVSEAVVFQSSLAFSQPLTYKVFFELEPAL